MMYERYARQIPLPQIGPEGQERLARARVSVIGCGGLGSPVITYLACAGVGHLHLIDCDVVEISNLNRQFLHDDARIGMSKAESAKCAVERMNPEIAVQAEHIRLTADNVTELLRGSDVVVDCVDHLQTRLLVGNACIRLGIPLVEGGVDGLYGFVMEIDRQSACLECLGYDRMEQPQSPAVLGAAAGVIGTLQATACIKALLDLPGRLRNEMLVYDGMQMQVEKVPLAVSRNCRAHGALSQNG